MSVLFTNKVDTDQPYYKVTVTGESGILAFSKHWSRGAVLFVQAKSDKYEQTLDRSGKSWLDCKSDNYVSEYLDSAKADKVKEQAVIEFEDKPKRRGRPKNSTSKE